MGSFECQGSKERHGRYLDSGEGCDAAGGRVRGFLQPRVLLLLLQQSDYGYALLERLGNEAGMPEVDPGLLYRTLRQMERESLLHSTWDTAGQGPARRRYEVTFDGIEMLHAWAVRIEQTRRRLDDYLGRYHEHFPNQNGEETA